MLVEWWKCNESLIGWATSQAKIWVLAAWLNKYFQLAVVKISQSPAQRLCKCKLLWHCLSLLLHMELHLKGDLMTGTMVRDGHNYRKYFYCCYGAIQAQSPGHWFQNKSDAYINNLKTSFKVRFLGRDKLRKSKNLHISTTLWYHAENVQQMNEVDIQMFVL